MSARFARKYYIGGQVQGVGFRYFAQRVAREFGVLGWARNLDDGRVEVYAQGTPHQLEDFEAEMRVGPPRATVRQLTVEEAAAEARVDGFHIR